MTGEKRLSLKKIRIIGGGVILANASTDEKLFGFCHRLPFALTTAHVSGCLGKEFTRPLPEDLLFCKVMFLHARAALWSGGVK